MPAEQSSIGGRYEASVDAKIRAVDVVGARTSWEAGEVGDLVRAGYPPDGSRSEFGGECCSYSWTPVQPCSSASSRSQVSSPRYPNEVARWVADELIIPTLGHLDQGR
jgi:hypothetical protein